MTIRKYRGDTKRVSYTVKDKDTKLPVDITGWTFLLSINPEQGPADNTGQLAQISGVISDALAGKVYFPFTGVSIDPGTYFYDIQATDGNGEKETLSLAPLEVIQDITKE